MWYKQGLTDRALGQDGPSRGAFACGSSVIQGMNLSVLR